MGDRQFITIIRECRTMGGTAKVRNFHKYARRLVILLFMEQVISKGHSAMNKFHVTICRERHCVVFHVSCGLTAEWGTGIEHSSILLCGGIGSLLGRQFI